MKDQLTEALQALKDKGGEARQAAIKAEIMTEAAQQTAEAISKGELWRIEIIARITKIRMLAASRPALEDGGVIGFSTYHNQEPPPGGYTGDHVIAPQLSKKFDIEVTSKPAKTLTL
jgi:hypothetical protein